MTLRASSRTLHLRYQPPYDWEAMLGHLRARAVPGVEAVTADRYLRTIAIAGIHGTVAVSHLPNSASLVLEIRSPDAHGDPGLVEQVRRMFDLDAATIAIEAHLSRDVRLGRLVARRPGLRVPGGWDGFELATRAVLGQQVTVAAARGLAAQLVALHGLRLATAVGPLTHVFPTAASLAGAASLPLKMPRARQAALQAVAAAAVADPDIFRRCGDLDTVIAELCKIPGVGAWTAHYLALRALRHPDAFPAGDAGLQRGAAVMDGVRPTAAALQTRSAPWRPWRAYAAQHLWIAAGPSAASPRAPLTRGRDGNP